MRLCDYPYVVVRFACRKCSRHGRYRLARLAERHGAEILLPWLLDAVATDCPNRGPNVRIQQTCGAYFVDLAEPRAPDLPPSGP